jgi:hypothetical protein
MAEFASKGVAGSGLGLGIAGTALGLLNNGGLGNLFGGWNNCGCSDNMAVTRHELSMQNEIMTKDSKIALLESNIYTDQKLNDLRNYIDAKVGAVEGAINAQAVYNATNTATINCIQGQVAQLFALTKTVIPITNVCPQPMPQYNSWTAPTTTTTTP